MYAERFFGHRTTIYVLVLGVCVAAAGTRVEDKRGQDKNPKKIINIPDKLEINYTHPASHLVRCRYGGRTNGAFLEQPLSGRRSTHIA